MIKNTCVAVCLYRRIRKFWKLTTVLSGDTARGRSWRWRSCAWWWRSKCSRWSNCCWSIKKKITILINHKPEAHLILKSNCNNSKMKYTYSRILFTQSTRILLHNRHTSYSVDLTQESTRELIWHKLLSSECHSQLISGDNDASWGVLCAILFSVKRRDFVVWM